VVPMIYVEWLSDFMQTYGIPRRELLKGTGLEGQAANDLSGGITESQHLILMRNALRLSGDPGLGLVLGFNRHISTLESYGFAIMCCETYGQAIQVGCEYQSTLGRFSGRLLHLSMHLEGNEAVLDIDFEPALGDLKTFAVEDMLGSIVSSTRWVTGQALPLREIRCAYPEPAHAHAYAHYFSCPVVFNARHTQVRFDAVFLNTPLPMASSNVVRIHLEQCKKRLLQDDLSVQDRWVSQIRNRVSLAVRENPSLKDCATALAVSPRTLRRKLQQRGLSYQKILDEVRLSLACSYLQNTRLSVEAIAEMVGFGESTSFTRAFKRWTGTGPLAYRQQRAQVMSAAD
jgi:AraC-like DNA-binding protein